jgi:hypothetical protein
LPRERADEHFETSGEEVFFGRGDFPATPKFTQLCGERCEHAHEHAVVAEADSAFAKSRRECTVVEILCCAEQLRFQIFGVTLGRCHWCVTRLTGVLQSGPKRFDGSPVRATDSRPRCNEPLNVWV